MEDKRKTNILCSKISTVIKCSVFYRICVCIVIFTIVSTIGFKPDPRTIRKTPNYPQKIFGSIGIDGFRLFMESDTDWDDRVSMSEFKYIIKHLKKMPQNWDLFQDIKITDELVTLKAKFRQRNLLINTNSEEQKHKDKVLGIVDHFEGFHGWQKPRKDWFNFAVRHFQQFLPPSNISSIGKIYEIIRPKKHQVIWDRSKTSELNSRRTYTPLDVEEKYSWLHKMLSMFHQNTFIFKREAPFGGYGVIRARNDDVLEIIFRIAVEFQLNKLENLPFWLTPEPLKGSLLLSTDYKHIVNFRMYLETDRELHVGNDLRMLKGQHYQVTDEHIREMSLESTSPSVKASEYNVKKRLPDQAASTRNIKWKEQMTRREAFNVIDKKMKIPKKKKVTFDSRPTDFIPLQDNMHPHIQQGNQPQVVEDHSHDG